MVQIITAICPYFILQGPPANRLRVQHSSERQQRVTDDDFDDDFDDDLDLDGDGDGGAAFTDVVPAAERTARTSTTSLIARTSRVPVPATARKFQAQAQPKLPSPQLSHPPAAARSEEDLNSVGFFKTLSAPSKKTQRQQATLRSVAKKQRVPASSTRRAPELAATLNRSALQPRTTTSRDRTRSVENVTKAGLLAAAGRQKRVAGNRIPTVTPSTNSAGSSRAAALATRRARLRARTLSASRTEVASLAASLVKSASNPDGTLARAVLS